jgi:hypothetical protein
VFVFRRSSSAGATDTATEESSGTKSSGATANDTVKERPTAQAAKGRPTPSRKDAQASRYQSIQGGRTSGATRSTGARTTPLTKEEKERQKAQARTENSRRVDGMKSGDEKYLGVRDRGPVRRLARNYVDSQRRPSEYYLYALLLLLVLLISHNSAGEKYSQYFVGFVVVVIVVDGYLLQRGLKRLLAERLPNESPRGVGMYAIFRLMQIRAMRMPKPQVRPGEKF